MSTSDPDTDANPAVIPLRRFPEWAERQPSPEERRVLETAYETYNRNSVWPSFVSLEATVYTRFSGLDLAAVLRDMPLGLLRPDPALGQHLPDEQELAVTLFGLTFLPAAADDVVLFFSIFLWAVRQRLDFQPPPTGSANLDIRVTRLIDVLHAEGRKTDAAEIARVLGMIRSEQDAPTFSATKAAPEQGTLHLPRQLRKYAQVRTLEDYFDERWTPRRSGQPSTPEDDLGPFTGETQIDLSPEAEDAIVRGGRANATAGATPDQKGVPAGLSIRAHAVADLASSVDALGFEPLVDGIADLVNAESTRLPLAMAVTGPWGAGKSSIMCQLRDSLQRQPGRSRRRLPWNQSEARWTGRQWWIVSFDAWKFERGEFLWAALTKAVYEAGLRTRNPFKKAWFRTRLEWDRQGVFNWFAKATAALVPLVGGLVYLFWFATTSRDKSLGGLLGIGFTVAAALTARTKDWSGLGTLFADPFKRAIDLYAIRRTFEGHLGFTADAASDVDALTRRLTKRDDSALSVFIDDLDRCSPAHVVEVVEAVNQIFNASHENRTLFVLGMDRDVVAASLNAAYANTIAGLEPQRRHDFGQDYLRKVVQLSVAVPVPDEPSFERLLDSILEESPSVAVIDAREEDIERAQQEIAGTAPTTAHDISDAASAVRDSTSVPDGAILEAARRERTRLFDSDAADVAAAERELLVHLSRNPRALKRFDTAYRLQLHVANNSPGSQLDFSFDQLIALGKWVSLRLRWPLLAAEIDDDPGLLRDLEAGANGDGDVPGSAWLEDGDLRNLLTEGRTERHVSALPLSTFLRVI